MERNHSGIYKKILNNDTKIIVCQEKYVKAKDRNIIFYKNYKSLIGGHREVSKTFNRIKIKINYCWVKG